MLRNNSQNAQCYDPYSERVEGPLQAERRKIMVGGRGEDVSPFDVLRARAITAHGLGRCSNHAVYFSLLAPAVITEQPHHIN